MFFSLKFCVVIEFSKVFDFNHRWRKMTKQERKKNYEYHKENRHSKTDVVVPHGVDIVIWKLIFHSVSNLDTN